MKDKQNNNPNIIDSELETIKKQAEEYLNNWKRERADFINYKKGEAKRVEEMVKFANESVIMELIEVLDEVEIIRKNFPDGDVGKISDWLSELDKAVNKFQEFLNKYGIERIKVRDKFDPALCEAVEVQDDGEKIEEIRAGYMMHDKVIRPTRVKIIK